MDEERSAAQSQNDFALDGYFIAMAVSQLIYGPLSDRYGRRRPTAGWPSWICPWREVKKILFYDSQLLRQNLSITRRYSSSPAYCRAWVLAEDIKIASIIRAIINDSYGRLEAAGAFATISGIIFW